MIENSDYIILTADFAGKLDKAAESLDVFHYNPLDYAWDVHRKYLERYFRPSYAFLLGMNPGPFGMTQNGVPFGERSFVRDYLKLDGEIGKPAIEHPRRPIEGFGCSRSEVSGRRLWGLISSLWPDPDDFVGHVAISGFMPLIFLSETGANVTPDKIGKRRMKEIDGICEEYLDMTLSYIRPEVAVGIGRYAQKRLMDARERTGYDFDISCMIHPSGGNPMANDNWHGKTEQLFRETGII